MSITEKLLASKNALASLLTFANAKTGKADPDIGEAIRTLVDGYGQGGGGGGWPFCYAYGSAKVAGDITARNTRFYYSAPNDSAMSMLSFELEPIRPGRPVALRLDSRHIGSFTNKATPPGGGMEVCSVTGGTNFNAYNTPSVTYIGDFNGQKVFAQGLPAQAVEVPSSGYEFHFAIYMPVYNVSPPRFNSPGINLGEIQQDTWVDVGDIGKIYVGWTDPTV